jgi:hypothetical protein
MRPWRLRFHAEMCGTSRLTIITYRGCRDTDLPDSSNLTPAQHLCALLDLVLKSTRPPQSGNCCHRGRIGRRGRAGDFSRASGPRNRVFRVFMRPGATFSGRTAGSGGRGPLSLGDVSPRRNVGPDDQQPSIGMEQSKSLDQGNGRRGAHRTHVECRGLYVLAR